MKDYLFKKAYDFYPKNINGLDNEYMNSIEIYRLNSEAKKSIETEYPFWVETIKKVNAEFSDFKILDKSNFTLNQLSLAMQGILDKNENSIITFNFYSSLLIPYYYFSLCKYEKESDIFQLKKIIVNPKDNLEMNMMANFIKKKIDKEPLSEKYLNLIIPKLSFESISEGNFKVMNAFFNHRHTLI